MHANEKPTTAELETQIPHARSQNAVMKLVTWNVNSLKAREEFVADYLDEARPDVVCLQELKLEEKSVPRELFEDRGYELASHGQRQWNGVLIASKEPIPNVVKGLPEGDQGQSRLIACQIGGLKLVNLYCPQGQAEDSPKFQYKLRFFQALRQWIGDPKTANEYARPFYRKRHGL